MANRYFNLKRLIIAVVFTAVVVLLTHLPQEVMPTRLQTSHLDKLAHALAYGVVTFLFTLSLKIAPSWLSVSILFFAILAIGAIDEITQLFVGRTASLVDWLADSIGVLFTLVFLFVFQNSKRQA